MKSDINETINTRVTAAFADISMGRSGVELIKEAKDLVRDVWTGKIYAALPKDKITILEYFFDAELERFLNEAIEECYEKMCLIAEQVNWKV